MQKKWYEFTLGKCYEVKLKDERVIKFQEGNNFVVVDGTEEPQDIFKFLYGVDISDSIVNEISCEEIGKGDVLK